jgi:hypothetical protein
MPPGWPPVSYGYALQPPPIDVSAELTWGLAKAATVGRTAVMVPLMNPSKILRAVLSTFGTALSARSNGSRGP